MERLKPDIKDPAITALVTQDLANAKILNVRKTPTWILYQQQTVTGGLVYAELREAYQKEKCRLTD